VVAFITRWLLSALGLALTAWLVPGIEVHNGTTLFIAALVLGLLNAIVKPLLILFTLPLTILTLGLFLLVINAILFLLAAHLVPGFEVHGFWPAFWGALVLSLISLVLSPLGKIATAKE